MDIIRKAYKNTIKSYDINYVDNIAVNLWTMFKYAVSCGYDPKMYWDMVVTSEVSIRNIQMYYQRNNDIKKDNEIYYLDSLKPLVVK